MNKIRLLAVSVGVVAVLGVGAVYVLSHGATSPANVRVSSVQVTDSTISVEGEFMGSAQWYNGYAASYKDGVLYVKLQVSSIPLPWLKGDPFTISIPNTYGSIEQMYLQGSGSEGDKQIWP